MGYLAKITLKHIYLTLPLLYAPIFVVNGEFKDRWKLYERGPDPIGGGFLLVPAEGDEERREAVLRVYYKMGSNSMVNMALNLLRLGVDSVDNVVVEPVGDDMLRISINKEVDAGEEQPIAPLSIKRIMFKKVRAPPEIGIIRFTRQPILSDVLKNKYTAASHMGGGLFKLVHDPLEYRRPYQPIIVKKWNTKVIAYIKPSRTFVERLGLKYNVGCFDYIVDVNNNRWLRLVPDVECGRRL